MITYQKATDRKPLPPFHGQPSYTRLFWYVDKTLLMSDIKETDIPQARVSDIETTFRSQMRVVHV